MDEPQEQDGGAHRLRRRTLIAAAAASSAAGILAINRQPAEAQPASNTARPRPSAETQLYLNVREFGARGDGSGDDLPAIQRALEQLRRESPEPSRGERFFVPSATLYFPPGRYRLSGTLSLKQQVRLLGESRGNGNGSATQLRFPANVTGILINRHNTERLTGSGPTTTSAEGTVIEGIAVAAEAGASPSSPATGIYARARTTLVACEAQGFARDGIALVANEGGEHVGNCNGSALRDCTVHNNGRHGLFIAGDNANACVIDNLNTVLNGAYGFYDDTVIGHTWIGGHSASNGQLKSGLHPTTAIVWHDGSLYALLPGQGHEAAGRRTPPPADPRVWSLRERGVAAPFHDIPAWRAGIALTEGGAGYIKAGRHIHVNPYTEGRQGPYVNNGAIALGGSPGAGFVGSGINVYPSEGHLNALGHDEADMARALAEAWARLRVLGT